MDGWLRCPGNPQMLLVYSFSSQGGKAGGTSSRSGKIIQPRYDSPHIHGDRGQYVLEMSLLQAAMPSPIQPAHLVTAWMVFGTELSHW